MLESAWLFIGTLGFLSLAVAVYSNQNVIATPAAALSTMTWGVWIFGALDVEVAEGGTVFSFSHPSLVMLGLAWALPALYITFTGPIELIGKGEEIAESGEHRQL